MKLFRKEVPRLSLIGLSLVLLSIVFYFIHFMIFRDPHHIFIFFVGDVAFVFIEVLLVTLIIHRLLEERDKQARLEKLNMVIGAFFSEVGTGLIAYFSDFDPRLDEIKRELIVEGNWSDRKFETVNSKLRRYEFDVEIHEGALNHLRRFLLTERDFLLRLLENPNLLEHEEFTELLRAVFHLTEELACRKDMKGLPAADLQHLAMDVKRAYVILVRQWLDYMKYLKNNYSYLFSLAMRTNPFDQSASPIIMETR
ncbi:MAG: hypothetical protein JXD19_02555 [Deltaproteobacteria bacterium]|nr:hypothetical protein [Deltaproteobacteria bacterium]